MTEDPYRILRIYADRYGQPQGLALVDTASLRDQFAMAALPALIADPESVAYPIGHAKLAYEYADAMLEARKEKK